jgi:phosphoribosylformimino-5-aminoimidazole carboxamide ribotide isomerase
VAEPTALRRLVELHGDRIAVGIDAREGLVQVKGWVETTTKQASELAREMADIGVSTIIYTDTATDGMLTGPNIPGMAAMCDAVPDVKIVASGGVSVEDDVRRLAALNRDNLEGVIVGKALYEGAVTMPGLIAAATT